MARSVRAKYSCRRNAEPALSPEGSVVPISGTHESGLDFLAAWIAEIVGEDLSADSHHRIDRGFETTSHSATSSRISRSPALDIVTCLHVHPERLSPAEMAQWIGQSPYGSALSLSALQEIVDRAEGVAQFAIELARLYATGKYDSIGVLLEPGTLNAALFTRLCDLGSLRQLARAASILGREFDADLLAVVLRMSPAQLRPGLRALCELGFLHVSPDTKAYRYSHGLLRDAAYASITTARRRDLHGRVAEVMVELEVGQPEVIAGHFVSAGELRGAFTWWRKAGQRAAENYCSQQAIAYLQRALDAREQDADAGSIPEEVEVRRLMGMQYAILNGNGAPEVINSLQRCLNLSSQLPRSSSDFETLWMLHSCYLVRGDIPQALSIGERLIAMVDRQGSEERRMRAHRMQGLAKLLGGQLDAAFAHYHVVLDIYDERRHADLRFEHASDQGALAFAHLSWGNAVACRGEASEKYANAALELAARLRHPHTSAHVICVLAARAQTLGEKRSASALAFAGKSLSVRHAFPYWSAWADLIIGWSHAGSRENGVSMIEQAIKAYRRTGATQAIPYAYLLLGDAALESSAPRRALIAFEEGWQLATRQGLVLYGSELLRMRAIAQRSLGCAHTDVAAIAHRAYALADQQGAITFRRRTSELLENFHPPSQNLNSIVTI